MIRQLIVNELRDSLSIPLAVLVLVIPILVLQLSAGDRLYTFIAVTFLAYLAAVIRIHLRQRTERRQRLVAELPVTPNQILLAELSFSAILAMAPAGILLIDLLLTPARSIQWDASFVCAVFLFALSVDSAMRAALRAGTHRGRFMRSIRFAPPVLVLLFVLVWMNSADNGALLFDSKVISSLEASEPDWMLTLAMLCLLVIMVTGIDAWSTRRFESVCH